MTTTPRRQGNEIQFIQSLGRVMEAAMQKIVSVS
jgi:hypothetical protein